MIFAHNGGSIDCSESMYPTILETFNPHQFSHILKIEAYSTAYGYVSDGSVILPNDKEVRDGEWFSYSTGKNREIIQGVHAEGIVIQRFGFRGQTMVGGPIEEKGRLCYIDGCSDSMLVYPPRMGDPVLNHLHFPIGIAQTFHTHPSIRAGFVARGCGYAELSTGKVPLEQGEAFVLEEHELHRFVTEDSSMDIIAYHPDSDWGPTDQNHPMLNRTYIDRK
jgi:hypothetical protein